MPGANTQEHRLPPSQYVMRKNLEDFTCPYKCACKFINDRSAFDTAQFQHIVDGAPINYPVAKNIPGWGN